MAPLEEHLVDDDGKHTLCGEKTKGMQSYQLRRTPQSAASSLLCPGCRLGFKMRRVS